MDKIQQKAITKKNTLILYGTALRYQMHKRVSSLAPLLFKQDLNTYNDTIQQRHQRNRAELKIIIQSLQKGQILPEMLEFLTSYSFYPSYVLHHHCNHFTKFVHQLAFEQIGLRSLVQQCQNFKSIGAIFNKTISQKFSTRGAKLINNTIQMPEGEYFYSFKTSLNINVCCVVLRVNNQNGYIFIRLRNENGQLCKGVSVKDLGATISHDYINVGYRFDGVQPLCIVTKKSMKFYRNISTFENCQELGMSIQDLMKSVHITVSYTSMRRQFPTLEDSKEQRRILTYQAVGSRILDGFAMLVVLGYFYQKLLNTAVLRGFMVPYLPHIHKLILQKLIELRQCCGGFGYMQVSGHPALMERAIMRASQPASNAVPQIQEILKRLSYYSSDLGLQDKYLNQLAGQEFQKKNIFGLFALVCINMRKRREQMPQTEYAREFFTQMLFQAMYSTISLYPLDVDHNKFPIIFLYSLINYSLNHAKFINWRFCKVPHQKYIESIYEVKNQLLQELTGDIQQFAKLIEITYTRNIIIGKEDSNKFYQQLFDASEKNKRNSEEYLKYVQEPLVKLLKTQRSKL